jgi:carbonic anhydrase/acetyltransferase-like protein (isoleucine patch superfamily)
MNYAEIGENCIIGAGTIITQNKKIPANSLVYGNPARIVRTLKPEEIAHVREMVMDYHKAAQLYLQG